MIHGRNLIVSIDGTPIAGSKSCRLSIAQEFLQFRSPSESRVNGKLPTIYDWGVSVDCLIPSSTLSVSLTDKLIAGTRALITFTDGSNQKRAGFAYVKNCEEDGSVGNLATFSASFESDGALYKYETISLQRFTEGNDRLIGFNSQNAIEINNRVQGDNIIIQNKYIYAGYKLYIYNCDVNWFVSTDTIVHVKSYISNADGQSLESYAIAKGDSDRIITISSSKTYVIAANDDAGIDILILKP